MTQLPADAHRPGDQPTRPRTIIITGASDGIGAAAARRFSAQNDRVVLVGRSPEKTAAIARELGADQYTADFSRLDEVRDLAATLNSAYPQIDVLANNAGGIMSEREVTTDGFEKTLQVNHLAPFLLTNLLMDTLVASQAKVITTASVAAKLFGNLDLDDLQLENRYSPNKAYGDAKLANILFASELDRRFSPHGISSASFHPGTVATSFAADSTSAMRFIYHTPLKHLVLVSPDKGANTLLWLANTTPGVDWKSGAFYTKRAIAATNPQAGDAALAARLWDLSAELVGLAR